VVPADVEDVDDGGSDDSASVYSQDDGGVRIDPCDFAVFENGYEEDEQLPLGLPFSPLDLETDIAIGMLELERKKREDAASRSQSPSPTPTPSIISGKTRILRSRWSTSTMSTVVTRREEKTKARVYQSAAAKLKGYFGGNDGGKKKPAATRTSTKPPPRHPGVSVRWSEVSRRDSTASNGTVVMIGRRESRSSRGSGESSFGGSRSSVDVTVEGLKRKPIPVEMFLRSSH
jgi:hypothetical protein